MTPLSLRLPPKLREQVESLAAADGQSTHGFLVGAIGKFTEEALKRRAFVSAAEASRARVLRTRKAYRAAEVEGHFRARAAGKRAAKPRLVKCP